MKRSKLTLTLMLAGALASMSGCLANPCDGVTCAAPQICQRSTGECVGPCGVTACPVGSVCNESTGRCSANLSFPPAPTLGAVVDRAGRPGVSTVLINPFDQYKPNGNAAENGDVTRDRYNADGDPSTWVATWTPVIVDSLKVLDGIDGACGNSVLASTTAMKRYEPLANLFADDQIYLDVTTANCSGNYLIVERKPDDAMTTDCGGRILRADNIDGLYSAMTTSGTATLTDGVPFSANVGGGFPFLGAPKD